VIAFALWLGQRRYKMWRIVAWTMAIAVLAVSASRLRSAESEQADAASSQGDWQPYSDARLEAARKTGQAVFVDFTAAWCITCQVNKATVLETKAGDRLFESAGILRLRAD